MKIFQWSAANDGSNWWRFTLTAQVLQQLGHHVDQSRYAITSLTHHADAVIAHRVTQPGPTLRWQALAARGQHTVFDLDDHLDTVPETSTVAHRFFTQPDNQNRLHTNLTTATAVTAATPSIAEWAARYNPNTIVIPNGLPAAYLTWDRPQPQDDRIVVGWAGSLHTLPELAIVAPALVHVLDRYRGRVVVHVNGVHPDEPTVRARIRPLGLDRPDVLVTPWADPGEPYLRGCHHFDIWAAPYRDIPFNRAKYPTKALEAMFLGIPLVASRVGHYRENVQHGQTGYLVRDPDRWVRYLRRLIDNPALRTDMGAAARAAAVHHIVEGYGPAWEEALTP